MDVAAIGNTNRGFWRTFVKATKYGILSKSLAVKSVSPLGLTFARVSLISARSLSWQSRCLANSQSARVSWRIREDRVQKQSVEDKAPTAFAVVSCPENMIVLQTVRRSRGDDREQLLPDLWNDLFVSQFPVLALRIAGLDWI